jgi:FkbM family methyltransferase
MKTVTSIFILRLWQFCSNRFLKLFRPFFELLQIDFLSKPYGAEKIEYHDNLLKYVNIKNGFFVELGGYDGFFHSPTYYLEKFKNWKGVLIEPHPKYYKRCVKNRSKSTVFNYACNNDIKNGSLILNSLNHSSYLEGTVQNDGFLQEALDGIYQKHSHYKVKVSNLTSILDSYFEAHTKVTIDLLVIDVEGTELAVLQGLDFSIYKPVAILCECKNLVEKNIIEEYLLNFNYKLIDKISYQDYLFKIS